MYKYQLQFILPYREQEKKFKILNSENKIGKSGKLFPSFNASFSLLKI